MTSSIKYNNLKEGKAIPINITAGVIVHTISSIVPCTMCLCAISVLLELYLLMISTNTHNTAVIINTRYNIA
jgi:hypothetical protein